MKQTRLSRIQEHFWLLNELSANSSAYNIFSVLRIKGLPVIDYLNEAINIIVSRHEILRASFRQEDMNILQTIAGIEQMKISIPVVSLSRPFDESVAPEEIENEVNIPFDLGTPPLFRIKLFIFSNNVSVLTIVFHHIIIDTRSEGIFSRELSELYNTLLKGDLPQQDKVPNQYSDYTDTVKQWYNSEEYRNMLNDWSEEFPAQINKIELPTDFSRPSNLPPDGTGIFFNLDKELISKISEYANKNEANTFRILLAAYAILLHKLTDQETIIIGVPLTNRVRPSLKDTIGCFVNILPVRIDFTGSPTCKEILNRVKTALSRNLSRQEIPFLDLVSHVKADRSTTNSFFQTGFTFKPQMQLQLNGLEVSPMEIKRNGSQLDLFLTLWEKDDGFHGYAEYNTRLLKESTIQRWIGTYKSIIEEFIRTTDKSADNLNILTNSEIQQIISWNDTDSLYENDICLHWKFEHQVQITPDAIALFIGNEKFTYSELNQHSNKLAHYLISKGIGPDNFVSICVERSPELMIGIFAILKAGGAYVPIDPQAPSERLVSILDDAKPKLILTTSKSGKNIPSGRYSVIYLDSILLNPFSSDDSDPDVAVNSHNLAYVIYTSGSTGIPKGAMIEHHSVLNRLGWMQNAYPLTASDVLLQKTPVTFDVSVWELFWWSFSGAGLVMLPPGAEKEPETLIETIRAYKVSVIHFVPSMFGGFLNYLDSFKEQSKICSLKNIFLSGEALPPNMVNEFRAIMKGYPAPDLINLYGPTEATVDVSYYHCPKDSILDNMYIGNPISNTKLLVLDKNYKIQSIGLPGELVITGVNLSRGYLNREELNKEKFIDLEYFDGTILRAYRTGDLTKWSDTGDLFYIGRIDNQVKIRGYRIELGDIESKLSEHDAVNACAVVVNKSNPSGPQLTAYVTLKNGFRLSSEKIKDFLSKKLPEYMVPAQYMFIDEMPLTSSGKINRKALPEPKFSTHVPIIEASNNIEKIILKIWKSVLKTDNISITSNFFDLGGNSILAINLVNLISKEFNITLKVLTIFEFPSIKDQSEFLAGKEGDRLSSKNIEIDEKIQRKKNVNFKKYR